MKISQEDVILIKNISVKAVWCMESVEWIARQGLETWKHRQSAEQNSQDGYSTSKMWPRYCWKTEYMPMLCFRGTTICWWKIRFFSLSTFEAIARDLWDLVYEFAKFVEYVDLSTQTPQRLLYTLSFRLELTTAIPCWLGSQRPSQTGFNVCLMRQPEWSVVRSSLIAACPNCFTPSYIGWTFLSVSSINLES